MFDNIRKMLNVGARKKYFNSYDGRYIGRGGSSYGSTMTFYKGSAYDNAYPNISRIANKFMTIRPFAIDSNGKPVKNARLIDKLYHPNQQMSSADFRETLAVMVLVHRKAYILVHREEGGRVYPGGGIRENNIGGFTFLEGVSEVNTPDGKLYHVGGQTYTAMDVIEIYAGVDPYNLGRGYSPSIAANKWANLDDYMAAYQAGLFENGGVPAGQFVITAPNLDAFNNIVDEMERKHRGSGRNNNVVYTMRPVDPGTGIAQSSQIEWIPFSQSNSDMNLDSLFSQTNKKLDAAYGVPDEIKGFLQNSNYASVSVAERIFLEYVVDPLALKIWTRFTFEMNRITGGLGYAIDYELDIPNLADEDRVRGETRSLEGQIIRDMVAAGYSLDSVVDAFELSNSYKLLKMTAKPTAPVIQNDKPDVDTGNEVSSSPDSTEKQVSKEVSAGTTESGGVHECNHKAAPEAPEDYDAIDQITKAMRQYTERQVDRAIKRLQEASKDVDTDEDGEPRDEDTEDLERLVMVIMAILIAHMLKRGRVSYQEGIKLLEGNGIPITQATEYAVSQATKDETMGNITKLSSSYSKETADSIQQVLRTMKEQGLGVEETHRMLKEIPALKEWQAKRIAVTEVSRMGGQAQVDAMIKLAREMGVTMYKVWQANPWACDYCQKMNGKRVLVDQPFFRKGETIEVDGGGTFLNNYKDTQTADLHPNCTCKIEKFEVQR